MKHQVTRKPSRFFMRMFISFALISCMAVLFGYVINHYVSGKLQQEVQRQNYSTLTQIANVFDAQLSGVTDVFAQLSKEPVVTATSEMDKRQGSIDIMQVIRLGEAVEKIHNSCGEDLFIYFPKSGDIISRDSTRFSAQQYFLCNYKADVQRDAALVSVLSDVRYMTFYPLREANTFMVLQPLPQYNTPTTYAVGGMILSRTYVYDAFTSHAPKGGDLLLLDAQGNVLLTSGNLDMADMSAVGIENSEYTEFSLNGMKYICQTIASRYTGYHYASVTPVGVFWERTNAVSVICAGFFSAYALLSILVAWRLSKRYYEPISELVGEIHLSAPATLGQERQDEFALIRSLIRKTQDEQTDNRTMRQNSVLRYALLGRERPGKADLSVFEAEESRLLSSDFTVLVLHIEQYTDSSEDQISEQTLLTMLKSLAPEHLRLFLLAEHNGIFVCIINEPVQSNFDVREFSGGILSFFEKNMGFTVTIACGTKQKGLKGIHRSYMDACVALKYRTVYGAGTIIPYEGLTIQPFDYAFSSREETQKTIVSCIKNNEPAPETVLSQILHASCHGAIRSPEEFKCFSFDICDMLRRIANSLSLSPSIVDALMMCDNLPMFESAFENTIVRIRDELGTSNSASTQNAHLLSEKVRLYIEQHYNDPSLSTNSVGNAFQMSGPYLSRLFMDEQGATIASYISTVRIENAKRMLREGSQSIEAISEQCGFLSSSTFIRLFKKTEEITPGAYRRIHG